MGVIRPGGHRRSSILGITGADLYHHLQEQVAAPAGVLRGFAQACYEHCLRGELPWEASARPEGILVLGPSGSGKTWLVSTAARFCRIPYVHAALPAMVPEGIVGLGVGTLLHSLDRDTEDDDGPALAGSHRHPSDQAQRGILCIDEICKLIPGSRDRSATYAAEVLNALLRVADGSKYPVEVRNGQSHISYAFDTSRLLLVYAGAFEGITRIVAKRLGAARIGFAGSHGLDDAELYRQATRADLQEYGLSGQFLGRISRIFILPAHTRQSLRRILASPSASPLARQKRMLETAGVGLDVDEDALDLLAEIAERRSARSGVGGARLLSDLVEQTLGEVKYAATNFGPMDIHCTREWVAMVLEPERSGCPSAARPGAVQRKSE
jgi:ATP-dependent Clp protease ATP-binding subunit ClpX